MEYEDDHLPSYSLIQPICDTGCMIDIYPGTHKCKRNSFVLHKYMSIRIMLPYSCCIIFSGDLIHNGTVSRTKQACTKKQNEDTRFFFYIQKENSNDDDNASLTTILRSSTSISPDATLNPKVTNLCELLEKGSNCDHCNEHSTMGKKIIDMNTEHWKDFIIQKCCGDVVFGDMEKFGFVVCRSYQCTSDIIHVIATRKTFQPGAKFPHLNGEPNRKLLFDAAREDVTVHLRNYDQCPIHQHMRLVHSAVVSEVIGAGYKMVKPNVIFNSGKLAQDQFPHWDFTERKVKRNKEQKSNK